MERCCGTCRFWQPENQSNRPASIRRISLGTCSLNGKEQKIDGMKGCFGWKQGDGVGEENR